MTDKTTVFLIILKVDIKLKTPPVCLEQSFQES